jgi:hypothetical protein
MWAKGLSVEQGSDNPTGMVMEGLCFDRMLEDQCIP